MLGLIIPLFFVIMLGVVAYIQSHKLQKQTETMYHYPLVEGRAIGTLRSDIYGLARDMKDLSLTNDDKKLSVEMDWIKWWQEDAVRNIEIIDSLYLGPRDDVDLLIQHFDSLLYICHQTIDLKMSGRNEEVLSRVTTNGILSYRVQRVLEKLQVIDIVSIKQGDELYEQSLELGDSLNKQLVQLVAVLVLLSIIINLVLLGIVGKPIAELTDVAQRLRKGDRNVRSSYVLQNEFGILAASFNSLAEEASRREMVNAEAVFESSPVAMLIIDEKTNIVMANLAAIALCGVGESDILQHRPGNALRCVHSSKDPRGCGYSNDCKLCNVRNGVEALITNGGSMHGAEVELQLIRNGEPQKTWLNVGVEPLLMRGLRHWTIAMEDITERKLAAEELLENELKYRALFETADDAILLFTDGRWVDCNAGALKVFGCTREQIIGAHPTRFSPPVQPDGRSSEEEAIKKINLAYEVGPEFFEWEHCRADGAPFAAEVSLNRLVLGGKPHIQAIVRDISVRKRAERSIVLNFQRMQALLQLNQMTGSTLKELTDFALEEAVRLTQSTIGYLAFLNEDESVLTMHSWSKSAMAECAINEKPIIYPVKSTGLWGEAVRQRKAVITNDYTAANPLKKGCPQGHVAVSRHMNAPVFAGSRIVLVAGVGNKAEEYDQGDVEQLTLLMESMWRIIERKRAEEKLHQQLNELLRWQEVTLGREGRNRQLKAEVNELLIRMGELVRYPSQGTVAADSKETGE